MASVLALGGGLVLASAAPAMAQVPTTPGEPIPGEVIVRFEGSTSTAERARALDRVDADDTRALRGLARTRLVEIPLDEEPAAAAARLAASPDVEWAEPNRISELHRTADDPQFSELWGLENDGQTVDSVSGAEDADVDAEDAWDTTVGDSGVLVGVVDSGIQPNHPDLEGNHRSDLSRNFVAGPGGLVDQGDWDDDNNHGSHVSGTIGAVGSNGVGTTGLNWDVGVFASRACDFRGRCINSNVAEALDYAGEAGARVVNVSLGGGFSNAVRDAIEAHPDTLYVVSAGNDGADNDTQPTYPCALNLDNIVCVAATDQSDGLASFSNFGDTTVDLGAPGVNVLSTIPNLVTTALGTDIADWDQDPPDRWFEESAFNTTALSFNDEQKPLPANSDLTYGTPLDLSGLDACRVRYFLQLGTTSGQQELFVEASSDGNVWIPIQRDTDGYSGSEFELHEEDLADFEGQSGVRLRYRLEVDSEAEDDPALVRIFAPSVVCRDDQPPGGAYGFLDGTSMASPHAAGVAALLFAEDPGLDVAGARSALLENVDPKPDLENTTASGGRLNAAKALASLSAPTPDPPPEQEPSPQPSPGPQPAPAPPPPSSTGQNLAALESADVCAPVPGRPGSQSSPLTLSKQQLLINQRVSQAAVRRAGAVEAWLDDGIEGRDVCGGTIPLGSLGAGLEGTSGPDRSPRPADPRPVEIPPGGDGDPSAVSLSANQLLVNQRVSQAAIRRAGALEKRLEEGLTGGDFKPGALSPEHLVPGLSIQRTQPAPRPGASTTNVSSGNGGNASAVAPTLAQLEINQKIGQAAVKRTNALLDRLEGGIRGSDIRPGSLSSENFATG